MMKQRYLGKSIGKFLVMIVLFVQVAEAMMIFIPNEQLVADSEYIVIATMQSVSTAGEKSQWGEATVITLKNELKVMESLKGSWSLTKPLFIKTLQFDPELEDNVKLPPPGSKVLLFLKRDEKSELEPVNLIQGVWRIFNGKFAGAGFGTTLEQLKEIVHKQAKTDQIQESCSSKAFLDLIDTAEIQTQAGHYKEALGAYRKAYRICPMKDLEEQMAWLMGEVGDDGIPVKKAIDDSSGAVVVLERTICYGTCPIYKVIIFGDGRVQYIGEKFVRIAGTRSAKISKEKVNQLIDVFQKAGYFSMKDSYTTRDMTDLPSAIISITVSGKTKTVTHYHGDTGAPKVLNELENRIDQTVDSQKWIRGDRDDKSVPL